MCELTRSFSAYDTLVVIPRTVPLPALRLAGEASGYGDGRQRSLALAGEDDIIPRGYRHGDDLRRVHWRSTARHGELMVRREEQPQRAKCTVLLDTRQIGYEGAGPDSAFEWAVSGAASALVHMLERGFAVRLLTDDGNAVPGEGTGGFAGTTQARRTRQGSCSTRSRWSATPTAGASRAPTTCCAAATRGCSSPSSAIWTRNRPRSRPGCGSAPGRSPSCWTAPSGPGRPARPGGPRSGCGGCAESGWTAVPVEPGDELPDLWQVAGGMRSDTPSAPSGGATGFAGGWS
ncbi:hypothetical protein SCALM49S_02073 [Streptomyces californicus]